MLVGARGMGVGDERKLHHGGQAQAEDEEQHNDAASLPAGMSLAGNWRASARLRVCPWDKACQSIISK